MELIRKCYDCLFHPSNLSSIISKKTLQEKETIVTHFSFTKNCLNIAIYHNKGNRVKIFWATALLHHQNKSRGKVQEKQYIQHFKRRIEMQEVR